ncbi:MAG: glycosyltransferase family 4 protein [bacterium]
MKPTVHFFGGQNIGWALDEDLARARQAVAGRIIAYSFIQSTIIHSAWWPPLLQVGSRALNEKKVVCFADNPPAFYLTRPGFEHAAARVDLWIARSQEAVRQFSELGLPVTFAPYTVDPKIFHPLDTEIRRKIRADLGLSEGDFVVGNFHRDSLERDLSLPKAQKGPDLFVDLVENAMRTIPSLKVLLAGPRRHWLRGELTRRGIPFLFVGEVIEGDDFSLNVLPREKLNALYAALDCVVISSRWEGGPYAALEALFAGRPAISTRVGMSSDLLQGFLYSTPDEGAALLTQIATKGGDVTLLRKAALDSHSSEALGESLISAYTSFVMKPVSALHSIKAMSALGLSRIHQVFRKPFDQHQGVAEIMKDVRQNKTGKLPVIEASIAIAGAEVAVRKP